ncbi:MAG TPA: hypothetical protein VGL86_28530 [Polyangia bacterium]
MMTAAAGCDKLDTNRTVDTYSSFGEIVYRESCQRVAYTGQLAQKAAGQIQTVDVSGALGNAVCVQQAAPPANAPAKLTAIVPQRSELIATVDAITPKDFLDTLEAFLEQLLPLSDDGAMEKAIASLGDLLGTMSQDPDFGPALSRLAVRDGYRPTKTAAGLVHTIVNYPNIDDFMGKTLAMIAPGGSAEGEWKQLMTAASMALTTVQPVDNPNDPERTLRLALNFLTSTHPDLADGTARPLVTRDYRGLALATTVNGKVQPPFVDMDGDGLADVDAMGHFVDATGATIDVASPFPELGASDSAPRDAQGRALTAANATSTLYQYLNLDGTVFGGLAREGLNLMDPNKDTTLGLVWGMGALLGPRASKTQLYMDSAGGMLGSLTYNGFDTTQSPVLDLAHGFVQLLDDPNADQTFSSVSTLLNNYESSTSRLVGAMLDASDRGKQHPEAVVPAQSVLYDDLMVILNRVLAVPGLTEDLMTALQDNRVKDLAPMIARLMSAKNQVDFLRQSTAYPLVNGGHDLDAIAPVDRTTPDVDYNMSLMQRIAHLIHDANGTQFCNKQDAQFSVLISFGPYDKCKLFEIDDLALFYILNMSSVGSNPGAFPASAEAGANFCDHITDGTVKTLSGDALIQSQTGIDGFTCHPSPAALNRSLFLKQAEKSSFLAGTTDDVLCSDGDKFIDAHDKSIFAWETTMATAPSGNVNATFYTAIQPIVDAFAKHDECIKRDPTTMACTQTQNAAKILVDLFAMLHTHWASPNASYFGHTYQSADPTKPRFSYPDNVVSYEPLMTEVLGQADLMPAILNIAPTLNTMTIDGKAGSPLARPYVIGSARYIVATGGAPGIVDRAGMTTTTRSDGSGNIPLTPYYLMADAFAHKRAALASGDPNMAASWKSATTALVDQLMTVQKNANGTYQFQNRRFRAISLLLINFLRSRIAAHATAGDLDTWAHQTLTGNISDQLSGPTFAALADFTAKIESDTDARNDLYGLLQYLVDEADNDLVFQTALTTLADQVQMFLDDPDLVPVARMMGSALDPTRGAVDAQLTLIKRAHDLDTNKAFLTIARNLYQQDPTTGVYPASNLADILSELNRAAPGSGGPLSGTDYQSILGEVQGFLIDDQRGFTRFLNIVQARGPH